MATPGKLKCQKKKQIVEFTADTLDNTAPVKKILEDLQNKNGQAYSFYCQNVRQRLTTKKSLQNFHFVVPGHPLNAFSDDWDGQLITNYFEEFPYRSFNPKFINVMQHVDEIDPVTKHMKIKSDWHRQCRNLRVTAVCSNMMSKYENLNEEVVRCPKHLVDMAAHLDSDPDPYFDSAYNWYYAGNGNLCLVSINWVDYLLHSELSCLYISKFNKNETTISTNPIAKYDCGEGNNIFETICFSNKVVALRTKNKIFILKILTEDDKIEFEKVKVAESEMPYTSITFDRYHANILYVTTLDNKLTIVNLDRMTGKSIKLTNKITSFVDNWNTVIGFERGFYIHATKNCLTLYDKSSHNVIHSWNEVRNVTDEIHCNDISAVLPTEGTSMYITTDHHVFLMDLRYFGGYKPKPTNRWTHGMQCVPTYVTKCAFEFNKDLICLSSQWCEDMCVISSSIDTRAKTNDVTSVTIPYRPPSILNTLKEARENMLCYDLYNPIDSRLYTAITGNLIIEHGEKYNLLMQNSLGDISCHNLFPEHLNVLMEDDSAQCLNDWSKSYKKQKKPFEVSSIADISDIWKNLKRVPSDYEFGENKLNVRQKTKFSKEEILNTFENEEIDDGLLEVWMNSTEQTIDDSKLSLNLHYTDDDE